MKVADALFFREVLPTGLLEDTAGILRRSDLQRIDVALERFRRLFPQLFFAIHIRTFRTPTDLQMFGFWLLNHAIFRDQDQTLNNADGILLVMDVESKQAGLTFGYTVEPYLDKTDTYACLCKAHSSWVNQLFADGMIALLMHLEGVLIRKHRIHRTDKSLMPRKPITSSISNDTPQVG